MKKYSGNKFTRYKAFYMVGGMKLITSPQAIAILKVEGKPINWRTFVKLTQKHQIKPEMTLPQGTKLWDIDKVHKLAELLPKKRVFGRKGML
jgi:hypothetical protein